jgi:FAD/FMN-containing dehydrogenase
VRIANGCTNPDLFWGIKGGGGGSFGVVTKLTLKTHQLPEFFGGVSTTIKATSDDAFRRLVRQFIGFYRDRLMNPHWGESATLGADNTLVVSMVHQGLTQAEAEEVWQPFVNWLAASSGDYALISPVEVWVMPAQDWWNAAYLRQHRPGRAFFDQRPGAPADNMWSAEQPTELGIFIHGYESVWLPAALLQNEVHDRFAQTLFEATRHWAVSLHFNKGLAGASDANVKAAAETAMNPAVTTAFALAIIAHGDAGAYADLVTPRSDLAAARRNAAAIGKAAEKLRTMAPDAGSYLSESNYFDRDWQSSFWGPNYARLRAAKTSYDPDGLFFVHHGVGSEDWSADGFTRVR